MEWIHNAIASQCDVLILCSDLFTIASFAILGYRVHKERTIRGISLQSLAALVLCRVIHALSHILGMHHQSESFAVIYMIFDISASVVAVGTAHLCLKTYKGSYQADLDDFGLIALEYLHDKGFKKIIPSQPRLYANYWSILYSVCACIGFCWFLIRRSHANWLFSFGICWYEVLTALAILPQMWMFRKGRSVPTALAHYVVLSVLARAVLLLFWMYYPRAHNWRYPDNRGVQMAAEALNILILSDFLYCYVKSYRGGFQSGMLPVEIPLHENVI